MSGSGDKTEPPTQKRIRDARKKGQIAKSKELASAAIIVTLLSYLLFSAQRSLELLFSLFAAPLRGAPGSFAAAFDDTVSHALSVAFSLIAPFVGLALLAALAAGFAQAGALIAPEAIKPDLKRLDPGAALGNIFSKKNFVELIKSLVKIAVLAGVVVHVVRSGLPDLVAVSECGLGCISPVLGALFARLVAYVSLAFVVVAVLDFGYQKYAYLEGMKMSKDEVKREFKEAEGNPEMKARRRSLFAELLQSQDGVAVRRSSVVVANPVHLAIGLYYERGRTPLPVVTLTERGLRAQRIVSMAEREGIPVLVDVPLACSLASGAEINRYIPEDLAAPVAEIFRLVRAL